MLPCPSMTKSRLPLPFLLSHPQSSHPLLLLLRCLPPLSPLSLSPRIPLPLHHRFWACRLRVRRLLRLRRRASMYASASTVDVLFRAVLRYVFRFVNPRITPSLSEQAKSGVPRRASNRGAETSAVAVARQSAVSPPHLRSKMCLSLSASRRENNIRSLLQKNNTTDG